MTTTSEPDADDTEVEAQVHKKDRLRPATVALTLAVLFMLACGAFAWLQVSKLGEQAAVPDEARRAAMRFAVDLGTYDYRDPDGNFALVAVESTDNFARQLVEITDALGPTLQQTQAVSSATVAAAAVLSSDGNRVVVDLYLDQTIENANTESPRVDRNRMEVTVLHVGDAWLLDQVETR
jgi:Mce-associated membrane protein